MDKVTVSYTGYLRIRQHVWRDTGVLELMGFLAPVALGDRSILALVEHQANRH